MIAVTDVDIGQLLLDTGGAAPDAALAAVLTELIDTGNFLDACKVGLFTGAVTPGPGLTLAAAVAAAPADAGYALSSVVVWGAADPVGGGRVIVTGDTKHFTCTTTPGDVVTGWFLQSAVGLGPILLKAARFKVPFTFTAIGVSLPVIPNFAIAGAA